MSKYQVLLKGLVLVAVVLSLTSPMALAAPSSAPSLQTPAWLNSAWSFRRPVTVSNAGLPLSDFQVHITLDASFDFGKARSDGSDLRITAGDGITLLPFWIERWTFGSASLWVKASSIPTGQTTLYLYYGNPGAAPASSGNGTFEFFDDFESSASTVSGYYNLSSPGVTVLQQDQPWESSPPHSLDVVEMNAGGYRYWGYYGLQAYPSGGPIGLARSNDLAHWDKYPTPIMSGTARWPSVLIVGNTLYMLYTQWDGNSSIVLATSSDGINFTDVKTVVQAEPGYYNGSPDLYYNPNDNQYYLYWVRISDSTARHEIPARSAASIENLDTAPTTLVLSSPTTLAAPDVMFYDGTYFLTAETIPSGIWQTEVWSSTSPASGFTPLPGNPILAEGSACFSQHVFGNTLHTYYCKLTGSTWTLDYRTADLTAGRKQFPLLDPARWTATGGTWATTTATQQNGASGVVAQGTTTGLEILRSSFSGGDYVLEAYGRQIAGNDWALGVRVANPSNYYSVNLYDNHDTSDNLYVYTWVGGSPAETAKAALGTINPNIWYKVTVKVYGSNLDVSINDTSRIHATNAQHSSGGIALYGENGTIAQFNDVLVRKYASPEPAASIGPEESRTVLGPPPAWLDPAWEYARPVMIFNAASSLTDFQIHITLDSSFDFGKARPDGSDLRITASDGVALLPFWIEQWTPSSASIWVRAASVPTGQSMLYVYYGNPGASSISSGDNTFEFFDDFESGNTTYGYYSLSDPASTVLVQDAGWETSPPHTLSVVEVGESGYQYWGYYGLQAMDAGGPVGLARSNDLAHWDKYSDNPIIGGYDRWPSVLKVGSTFYMMYTKWDGNSSIVLATSSDGINFTDVKTVVQAVPGYYTGSPNLFYHGGQYYLYWVSIDRSTNRHDIPVRSASSIESLDTASTAILLSSTTVLAAPNMMFYDGTYFLTVETIPTGVWQTDAWSSTSPTSGFAPLPDNPILADGSACLSQHVFGNTLHTYYCKLTGSTWTIDYRTANLAAGRRQFRGLDPSKWTASGGAWTVISTTQQNGASGYVAQGSLTGYQVLRSAFSGGDYVVEAYGRQMAGNEWGLGFRAADPSNLYTVNLYDNHDTTDNLYVYNWVGGSPSEVAKTALGTINPNTWYKMTVKVYGSNMDVSTNDIQRIHAANAQHPSGGIALFGESGTVAQFDNVLVRKYATPEPSTNVGPEQHSPSGPPPLPSSFYGEIYISDNPPVAGDTVEAHIAGVTRAITTTIVQVSGSALTYVLDVPGDVEGTSEKEGGVEGDTITFTVKSRVVAYGTWHSGTNTRLDFYLHGITLQPGWNLCSLNLIPANTDIATVLTSVAGNYDLVYAWNAQTQVWLKYDNIPGSPDTLSSLDEKMGFWIHMSAADELDVIGSIPSTTNINLYAITNPQPAPGWNLVGYPANSTGALPAALQDHGVGTDFSLVYAYQANDPSDPWKLYDESGPEWANDLTALSPLWGYWVSVNANHTWHVEYP